MGKGEVRMTAGMLILLIVVVGGLVYLIAAQPFAAVVPGVTPQPTVPTVIETVEKGKSATVSLAAFDNQADSATQVALASGLYVWKNGILVANGEALSSTTRTEVSAATGDSLTAIAFDSTYPYATETTIDVDQELVYKNLDTNKGISTSDLQVKFYYDGDVVTSVTMGASEVIALDKITAKVNTANKAWNPGAICFNVTTGSNIDNIDIPSLTKISVPERIDDTFDWCFELPEGLLSEWDTLTIESVEIKASSTNPAENITVAFLDKAPFIKIDNTLGYGLEDDSSSPSDVGIADIYATLEIA